MELHSLTCHKTTIIIDQRFSVAVVQNSFRRRQFYTCPYGKLFLGVNSELAVMIEYLLSRKYFLERSTSWLPAFYPFPTMF